MIQRSGPGKDQEPALSPLSGVTHGAHTRHASQGHTGATHDTPRTMADTPQRERPDRAAANARMRRYRLRKAGLLPPVLICPQCGGQVRAAACRRCWRLSDEGRAWNRARMRQARQRDRH